MSIRPLCVEPHPVLRRKAAPVVTFAAPLHQLARDMIETMYANDGIGLAAPQIGQGLAVFVANPSQQRGQELVVVNPMLDVLRGRTGITEGCLSLPNTWEHVRRAAQVRLTGQDLTGQSFVLDAEGLLAIVLQHEFDHLQGRLLIDRLSWFRRRFVTARTARRTQAAVCSGARQQGPIQQATYRPLDSGPGLGRGTLARDVARQGSRGRPERSRWTTKWSPGLARGAPPAACA